MVRIAPTFSPADVRTTLILISASLLAGSVAILGVAHVRSRSKALPDVGLRVASLLLVVVLFLAVADALDRFGGSGDGFALAASIAIVALASHLLLWGSTLLRRARATGGGVVLPAAFVEGLERRLASECGAQRAREILFGVARDAARDDAARLLEARVVPAAGAGKLFPTWFELLGEGTTATESPGGGEVRLAVRRPPAGVHQGACEVTRGYLAGLAGVADPARGCRVEEVSCCGGNGGRGRCEFVVRWSAPGEGTFAELPRRGV